MITVTSLVNKLKVRDGNHAAADGLGFLSDYSELLVWPCGQLRALEQTSGI